MQRIKGVHGIALGFRHLLPVFVLYQAQYQNVFIRRFIKDQSGNRQKRIKPPSGLVHGLTDKVRRKMLFKNFLVFKRIVPLRKRHGARVEPAVDHLFDPRHFTAAFRAADCNAVDIRLVQLDVIRAIMGHGFQLGDGTHRMPMAAAALPDIQRRPPVAVTADAPVLHIVQPVSEPSLSNTFRNPVYLCIIFQQLFLYRGHSDEPRIPGIINQRGIAAPAVRIGMFKGNHFKQQIPGS